MIARYRHAINKVNLTTTFEPSRVYHPDRSLLALLLRLPLDPVHLQVYVLEFKRTSDQRKDYREKGEARARAQHDVLIRSLEKVAGETESEGERWKVKLIVFVGGTCGSVHVQTFNVLASCQARFSRLHL